MGAGEALCGPMLSRDCVNLLLGPDLGGSREKKIMQNGLEILLLSFFLSSLQSREFSPLGILLLILLFHLEGCMCVF